MCSAGQDITATGLLYEIESANSAAVSSSTCPVKPKKAAMLIEHVTVLPFITKLGSTIRGQFNKTMRRTPHAIRNDVIPGNSLFIVYRYQGIARARNPQTALYR